MGVGAGAGETFIRHDSDSLCRSFLSVKRIPPHAQHARGFEVRSHSQTCHTFVECRGHKQAFEFSLEDYSESSVIFKGLKAFRPNAVSVPTKVRIQDEGTGIALSFRCMQ
jgi:hypothetical protein